MTDLDTLHVAALAGAAGFPLVLGAGRPRTLVAGLALLTGAEVGLVGSQAVPDRLFSPAAAAAGVLGAAAVAALAVPLVRRPALVTPVLLAAAPFRLPLDFGREHRFFVGTAESGELGRLLPLYLVLAAATAALLWRTLRARRIEPVLPLVAWPATAFLVLAALSLLWTDDSHAGTNLLAYFLIPFALLVAVVARAPFPAWMPRALGWVALGLGLVFSVVGLVQAATDRLLFYAPNLEVSNSYSTYFRVTSLFRDPSLYGRHLVLAIAVVLSAVWLRRVPTPYGAAAIAVLWLGLYFSYSQSSFVALFVVAAGIAGVAGDRRVRLALAGTTAVLVLVAGGVIAATASGISTKRITSDRSRRVELTARVYEAHPLVGVGLGGQPLATQRRATNKGPVANFVSHATPLTIAAELGTLGLVLYGILLAAAVRLVEQVRRVDAAVGLALGAALLALFVHSLFYSGFFEDPITWFALGLGASVLAARAVRPAA